MEEPTASARKLTDELNAAAESSTDEPNFQDGNHTTITCNVGNAPGLERVHQDVTVGFVPAEGVQGNSVVKYKDGQEDKVTNQQ